MGIKLSELEAGFEIKLKISSDNSKETMDMKGVIKSIVKSNIAIIDLDYPTERRLNFDNVKVDLEYCQDENVPILWRDVKIAYYKGEYVLQAPSEGKRHNRRGCFRVGVSVKAAIRIEGKGTEMAMIRDVSLSGYSISDRRKELNIDVGDKVSAGDKLAKMDLKYIEENATSSITPVIFTNLEADEKVKVIAGKCKVSENNKVSIVK